MPNRAWVLTERQKREIVARYERREETVAAIAASYGVTKAAVTLTAKRRGCRARVSGRPKSTKRRDLTLLCMILLSMLADKR